MQLVGTLAVVVSVLVLAYQGRELAGHTRVANEVAGTQAHRALVFHFKSLVDVFIQHPELHAYYFGQTTASPSASDSVRLKVIAEQHADWLDTAFMTSQRLGSYEYPEWIGGWADYLAQAVASSPPLRSIIRDRRVEYPSLDQLVKNYDASHDQGGDHPTMPPAPATDAPPTPDPDQG